MAWKPIQDPLVFKKLLGYKIAWKVLSEGEEEIEEAPWKRFTVRKDTLTTTIQGLTNFVRYQVEVSGFTRGGFGPSGITFGGTLYILGIHFFIHPQPPPPSPFSPLPFYNCGLSGLFSYFI